VGLVLARERALRIALAEAREGVREVSENTSKRIREYQAADSFVAGPKDTGYAWCNSFVVWCYREARRELTETGRSPSVPTTATLARDAGWVVRKPKRGDVVCFQLPVGGLRPVDKTPDHIGISFDSMEMAPNGQTGRAVGEGTLTNFIDGGSLDVFVDVSFVEPTETYTFSQPPTGGQPVHGTGAVGQCKGVISVDGINFLETGVESLSRATLDRWRWLTG
jgi:hypothetical protein